ncbi:MAG: SPOR domain-containing protein [Bacteroidia bacterium]|nr:SPOR domain-containing protein [Bacteroidia bacterium]
MNIDAYINKLLFDHDCVIVPGLGGFVASPRPAMHNRIHHSFIPPARVIAFNVFLRQNDGLLASCISADEKIPFNDAMNFMVKYVERCFMEMETGRRFVIADVGQLYYDAEKNIQFDPDDSALHFLDSFGLPTIRLIPVNDKERGENILLSPLRQSVSPKEKRKAKRKLSGRQLMNAVLITGITLWASFNLYIITPHNFNFGNLNPFEKTASSTYTPRKENVSALKIILPPAPAIQPSINETINPVTAEKTIPEGVIEKKVEENTTEVTPKGSVVEEIGNYFVVAGVFKIPSNAEHFLSKLKTVGYANSGSIERGDKPTMIFVTRHQQKENAVESMHQLKEQGIDAWIFLGK